MLHVYGQSTDTDILIIAKMQDIVHIHSTRAHLIW